jgi:hypothetical protein
MALPRAIRAMTLRTRSGSMPRADHGQRSARVECLNGDLAIWHDGQS